MSNLLKSRAAPWLVLALLIALATLARLHTYAEPLERDLHIYDLVGHGLLQGEALYSQQFDIKPPGIYATYAAAEPLFGLGQRQIFALGWLAWVLTALGFYALFARAFVAPWVGVFCVGLWLAWGHDLALQANQPNTEVFINACLVWACALLARPLLSLREPRLWLAAGLLLLASTYKQVAVLVPAGFVVAWLLTARDAPARRRDLLAALVLAVVGLVGWGLLYAWFAATGRGELFLDLMLSFPGEYTRLMQGLPADANLYVNALGQAFRLDRLAPDFFAGLWWLALPAIALTVLAWLRGPERRVVGMALVWLALTPLMVALPGPFYPHYYQLWLPPLILAAGIGVLALARLPGRGRYLGVIAAIAALTVAGARAIPNYRLDAVAWSTAKYGPGFHNAERLGRALRAFLQPDETIFVWGVVPGLYLAAEREPPTGVANIWLSIAPEGGHLSDQLAAQVLAGLQATPPELVLLDQHTLRKTPPTHPVGLWLRANYVGISSEVGYTLAVRRGGKLERRVEELASAGQWHGVMRYEPTPQ